MNKNKAIKVLEDSVRVQKIQKADRLKLLNNTAIQQMRLLTEDNRVKKLEGNK